MYELMFESNEMYFRAGRVSNSRLELTIYTKTNNLLVIGVEIALL